MRKPSVNLDPKWIGQKFGKLTVIGFGYEEKHQRNTWKCICDCGKKVEALSANVKTGRVKSCGCVQLEAVTTHGQRYTRLYRCWVDMRRRCRDVNHKTYYYYGARGIRVCDEWQQFEPFYKWAMSNGYSDDLTLDRIDVNGNYEPCNCRWANAKTQARNRRSARMVTVFGETLCVVEAIEKYGNGIHEDTVLKRMDKHGYSPERAITTPI